jgi:hypothetical protein
MVTFGFSAFLKVLSLNEKPQKTEIRKRLAPSSGGGYDFHKSLRQHARRYLVDGEAMRALIASAGTITRVPERQSAIAALERLEAWRAGTPGEILDFGPVVFESPQHLFRVRFEPAFGLRRGGRSTAIHIWNNKRPPLAPGPTYAALALVDQALLGDDHEPDDVGVLSLRESVAAYYLSDGAALTELAASLVQRIEDIIRGGPPPSSPEDRPFP